MLLASGSYCPHSCWSRWSGPSSRCSLQRQDLHSSGQPISKPGLCERRYSSPTPPPGGCPGLLDLEEGTPLTYTCSQLTAYHVYILTAHACHVQSLILLDSHGQSLFTPCLVSPTHISCLANPLTLYSSHSYLYLYHFLVFNC